MHTQDYIGKWNASSCRLRKCLPHFLLSGLKWATRHRRANDAFVHTRCHEACANSQESGSQNGILPLNCREYGLVQSTVVNLRQRQARQYIYESLRQEGQCFIRTGLECLLILKLQSQRKSQLQFNLFRVSQPSIWSSNTVQTSLQCQQTISLWLYNVGSYAKVKRI